MIGFASSLCSSTTEPSVYAEKTRTKRTQVLTWKTHNDGKNHGSPQAAEYTMGEKITTVKAQGQRPLALLSSPHAAVTMEATTSLSLSLSPSLTLSLCTRAIQLLYKSVQQQQLFFALSHIYTYMTFGLFTHVSPSNRSSPIDRVRSVPDLQSSGSP